MNIFAAASFIPDVFDEHVLYTKYCALEMQRLKGHNPCHHRFLSSGEGKSGSKVKTNKRENVIILLS
jgi:hypothetical protein